MAGTGRQNGVSGRKAGVPNRSTEQVRRAVAELLTKSAPRMIEWLEQVACGIREPGTEDPDTGLITPGAWIIRPDPKGAVDLVLRAAEFHIPKLARTEVSGDPEHPLFISKIELVPLHGPSPDRAPE